MKDEHCRFLSLLGRPPARLRVEQVASFLNCETHDIPVLVTARLLLPLGSPKPNAVKFFATAEVLERANDVAWLAKVTKTLSLHWQNKNARKKLTGGAGEDVSLTTLVA